MDFTNEEKERISQLYGNDFEGITPEDGALIGRWEAWKALEDGKYKAEMEAIKQRTEAKIADMRAKSDEAREVLKELRDKANQRFERLSDEPEK